MKTFKEFILEDKDNSITYPNGVYMAVLPDSISNDALGTYRTKYLKHLDEKDFEQNLHCTLIYSAKPHVDPIDPTSYKISAQPSGFELFGPNKDILVLTLHSVSLKEKHEALMEEYNFMYDFDEYTPHITLAVNAKGTDLNSLPLPDFEIVLGEEYVEALVTPDEDDEETSSGTFMGKAMSKVMKKDKED
jgi:2'-5' RNA ligase